MKKTMKRSWTLSESRPTSKRYIKRIIETQEREKEIREYEIGKDECEFGGLDGERPERCECSASKLF